MTSTAQSAIRFTQPALKYNFYVSFLDDKNKLLPFSDDLRNQVVSVSSFMQKRDGSGESIPASMHIHVEEDVSNSASRAAQKLLALEDFTLRIETLDKVGNVIKTTDIQKAWLHQINHGDLDYSSVSGPDQTVLKLKIPEPMGSAINMIRDKSPEVEMIFQLLADSELVLHTYESHQVNLAVSSVLVIGYNPGSVTVSFSKPNLKVV